MSMPHAVYDIYNCPLGSLYLVFSGRFLVGVSFRKPADVPFKKGAADAVFIKELDSYFQGTCMDDFSQSIKFQAGTDFEKQVWSVLSGIPCGETRTYKWVAEKVGNPSATRAVGRALSKNPIPIVVPCHRVIESDGSVGGYSSGIDRKRRLLEMEYYSRSGKKDS